MKNLKINADLIYPNMEFGVKTEFIHPHMEFDVKDGLKQVGIIKK